MIGARGRGEGHVGIPMGTPCVYKCTSFEACMDLLPEKVTVR